MLVTCHGTGTLRKDYTGSEIVETREPYLKLFLAAKLVYEYSTAGIPFSVN
jgi:hypothetical protein